MPFAAALSLHPDPAVATGEVAGQALDALAGGGVDLALVFAAGGHAAAIGEVAGAVRTLLQPSTLLGCSAASVLANGREAEEVAAVALWAGRFGRVHPVRFGPGGAPPADPDFEPAVLLLLGDAFSFAADTAFDAVAERWPGLPIVGGLASAARGPGGTRLVLDGDVLTSGAVGVFLGPGVEVETVVSQGCRPVGPPYAVTAADGNVVRELAGRRATDRLHDLVQDGLTEDEVATIDRGGLLVGRLVGDRSDFLVRNLVGTNRTEGWIVLEDPVEVGDTLQYHRRDADAADDDLRALLTGRSADTALVFTCGGRGVRFFDAAHHDAAVVEDYLGRLPVAGMFCAAEFGPVGGRNFVHGSTVSIALLRERPGRR